MLILHSFISDDVMLREGRGGRRGGGDGGNNKDCIDWNITRVFISNVQKAFKAEEKF